MNTPSTPSKPKFDRRILLAIGGSVLFLCVVCGVVSSVSSRLSPKPTPDVGAIYTQAAQTAIAGIPTATPSPRPTETPVPTDTPQPTATQKPAVDPYVIELASRFWTYQTGYLKLNDQIQMVSEDPTLMLDTDWKVKTGAILGLLDFAASQLENIPNVPSQYSRLDGLMDSLAAETHSLTKNLTYGIDHIDVDSINQATINIQNIGSIMQQATAEIQALQQ